MMMMMIDDDDNNNEAMKKQNNNNGNKVTAHFFNSLPQLQALVKRNSKKAAYVICLTVLIFHFHGTRLTF